MADNSELYREILEDSICTDIDRPDFKENFRNRVAAVADGKVSMFAGGEIFKNSISFLVRENSGKGEIYTGHLSPGKITIHKANM